MQFACLRCCVPPDFVVQINNFFSLVLCSVAIRKRRGKKLIWKTVNHKLDISLKMQFPFFCHEDIQKNLKNIKFFKNLEMTQIARGGGSCSSRHYDAMCTKMDMQFTLKFKIIVSRSVFGELQLNQILNLKTCCSLK